jgi:hypothetical protein
MGDCTGWIPPGGGSVNIVSLEGTVVSVDMAAGQEFPTFTLSLPGDGQVTIITGPYYFLIESGFEIRVGDRLLVQAFLSLWYDDTYVAVKIWNLTTGDTLILRDASGQPVWPRSQQLGEGGMGYGGGAAWLEIDPASIRTIKGTVEGVNPGVGEGHASIIVVKSGGKRFSVLTGPYRFMLENSFEIRAGHRVKVRAYKSTQLETIYVAAMVNNKTAGKKLNLLDESGRPYWDRNGRP